MTDKVPQLQANFEDAKTLLDWEKTASEYLHSYFEHFVFVLPAETYDFLIECTEVGRKEIEGSILDEIVSKQIIMRIAQDLRSVQKLCEMGYVSSAATIAASILELAYEVKYIAGNNERAHAWPEHTDLKNPDTNYFNRMQTSIVSSSLDQPEKDSILENERTVYMILSAHKHGNSTIAKLFGYDEGTKKGQYFIHSMPTLNKFAMQTIAYVLYHAMRLAVSAGTAFIDIYNSRSSEHYAEKATHILVSIKKESRRILDLIETW